MASGSSCDKNGGVAAERQRQRCGGGNGGETETSAAETFAAAPAPEDTVFIVAAKADTVFLAADATLANNDGDRVTTAAQATIGQRRRGRAIINDNEWTPDWKGEENIANVSLKSILTR